MRPKNQSNETNVRLTSVKLQMKLSRCSIQKKGDKTKTSRNTKSVAEFGKTDCQLKTTCGTNVKLLVSSPAFVNFVYPKKYNIGKEFFCMKKCRGPVSDHKSTQI